MNKFLCLSIFFLLAFKVALFGQEITVTGTVTATDDGSALPGVNILVQGTTTGAITDVDGNYSIVVPGADASLIFSYIGYISETIVIGSQSVINVNLVLDMVGLQEVVITALGIERKARDLSYASEKVSGDELTAVKSVSLVNSLVGKTAGLQINQGSGGVGSSKRIVLRGLKSTYLANQPLIVIDGIPLNPSVIESQQTQFGARDNGDPLSSINPDDIESINLLKGASAAALYGSQAANGVIMIVTKKAKKGDAHLNFSSTATFEKPMVTPQLQGKYGQEIPGVSVSTWDTINDATNASSADILDELFITGQTYINALSLTKGNEFGQFYASYANTSANGIIPENTLSRNNFKLRASTTIKDKVTVDASATYINEVVKNTPSSAYYNNPFLNAATFPSSLDSFKYYKKNYQVWDEGRSLMVQNYPYKDVLTYVNENPFWDIYGKGNTRSKDKGIYTMSANWNIIKNLNLIGRANMDRTYNKYTETMNASTIDLLSGKNGEYRLDDLLSTDYYGDALLTYNGNITSTINLNAVVGFSTSYNETKSNSITTLLGAPEDASLVYANTFGTQFISGIPTKEIYKRRLMSQALFGNVTVGFKDLLFVDGTVRNEWSSTTTESFIYPSVGLTFIASEIIGENDILSYAKIRGSYSEVGNALPFGVSNPNQPWTYDQVSGVPQKPESQPFPGVPLEPERAISYEFGTNVRLFNNRIDVDFTYYNNKTLKQFVTVLAGAGGGNEGGTDIISKNWWVNGGEIKNTGIEIMIGYKVISNSNFKYDASLNFSRNKNTVIDIHDDIQGDRIILSDIRSGYSCIPVGGSYGDIYAQDYLRDSTGKVMTTVGALGFDVPMQTPKDSLVKIGNPNPDFMIGFTNSLSYKGIILRFTIDGSFGGEMINLTQMLLDGLGRTQVTADAMDAGEVIFEGESYNPRAFYETFGGTEGSLKYYTTDMTNIRLRELSIGYTLPKKITGKIFENVTISVVGRNLFFFYNAAGDYDPELSIGSGNALQGVNNFILPSTRSFGFNLNATF